MYFLNSDIIRSDADVRIGLINTNSLEMSYYEYMESVRVRIIGLVNDYIKDDMGNGASKEQSISDIVRLLHEQLNYQEKDFPTDVLGIVEEIMNSLEYRKWNNQIKNRFLDVHVGPNTLETQIPAIKHSEGEDGENSFISGDVLQLVEEEDSLIVFLEGLASKNFID